MPVVGGVVLAKNSDGIGYVPWSLIPGQVSGSVAGPSWGLQSWGRGQSGPCSGSVVVSGVQLPGFHLCVLGPNYITLVTGVKRIPFS